MKIKEILSTNTFKQSMITFLGTLINGSLGAIFFIFMARWLGPAKFGIFGVGVTVLTLVADISDFGISTGIIRFVGKYAKKDEYVALKYLKASFNFRLFISLIVLLIGLLISHGLAINVFSKPELENILYLAFIGAALFLLYSFITFSL